MREPRESARLNGPMTTDGPEERSVWLTPYLITGGAGFIGRYVARALLAEGHRVRVLDSLIEQVHGGRGRPDELDPDVELVVGDVRDEALLRRALAGVDKVVHLAAEVGVGQSMYAVDRYVSVNDHGTAVLFQQLIDRPVKRVVVASSMSIYGEGLYRTADGALVEDAVRQPRTGADAPWDPLDDRGRPLVPVPTPEMEAAGARLGLRHHQARAGAADPDVSRPPTAWRAWRCACGTSTGRARRSPTPTPACWRSSPRASTTARRR